MSIEMRQRKVGKNHVVTLLPEFKEGQTVTVARLDARTAIVSMDSPERVQALAAQIPPRESSPWDALMGRIAGRPHHADAAPRRRAGAVEPDAAVSDQEALAFATAVRPRRKAKPHGLV